MEYLAVYNENGFPTGEKAERSIAHEKGILHGAAHVYIYYKSDSGLYILLQKRSSNKDSFPSCWDTSCAGHVTFGDTMESTAVKELKEELGIDIPFGKLTPLFTQLVTKTNIFYSKEFKDFEYNAVFALNLKLPVSDFNFQQEEISDLKWMNAQDLLKVLENKDPAYCINPETYKKAFSILQPPRSPNLGG